MSILNYIKKYGVYSFEEKAFNEVDNVIFSCLSYINFDGIVSTNFNNKLTINEVYKLYTNKNTNKNEISAVRNALDILRYISSSKRYKDVLVYNYQYVYNHECQFGAISFDLDTTTTYVSYEGTDDLISGWKEDCMIAYNFPVESQTLSIKYLNRYLFKGRKLIVGGHSKGGNLAIEAAMHCIFFVKRNIINIYSNDGLGIRKEELDSKKYASIRSRVIKIIPNYSIVGHLLYSDDNYEIIKSTKKSQSSHNPGTWIVNNDKFERGENSRFCKVLKKSIDKWSSKYDEKEKMKLIDSVFYICDSNNFKSLREIKIKLLVKMILDSRLIDSDVKNMLKQLYKIIIESNRDYKRDE